MVMTIEPGTGVPPATPLVRNRNFRLLWIGGAVSALGTRASSLAYPLLVLALGGTAADAGWVGFASAAPFIALPVLLGPLVDRWDRRRVMLVADAGRLAAMLTVVIALSWGTAPLALLASVAAFEGALLVAHNLAEPGAIRASVPDEQLGDALSGSEARGRAAFLLGQPLGGALFGFVRWLPFGFDALTYVVSIGTTLGLRGRFRIAPQTPPGEPGGTVRSALSELGAGIAWLWRQRFLRAAVVAIAASNLLFQALTLVVVVAATGSGASSAVVGLLFVGAGVGGVLGSLAASWCARRASLAVMMIGVNWAWAALTPLIALTRSVWLMDIVFAAIAFCGPLWNVAVSAHQLKITPEHLLARVGAAIGTVSFGAIPLGSLLAGVLLSTIGPARAGLALGGLMLLVAVMVTVSPAVRSASRDAASQPFPSGV
jgi:predicted MFS family arabinose efflux permease